MKLTYLSLACLPLVAVATFYMIFSTPRDDSPNHLTDTGTTKPLKGREVGLSKQADAGDIKRRNETNAQIAAGYAAVAKAVSGIGPESRLRTINSMMELREPRYRELFSQWNLSENSRNKALEIIRGREINLYDEAHRYARETSAEVGDHTDFQRVQASVLKTKGKLESAQVMADAELLPILSSEQLQELHKLDDRLRAESVSRSRKKIAD